jgi:hypothetical protein
MAAVAHTEDKSAVKLTDSRDCNFRWLLHMVEKL